MLLTKQGESVTPDSVAERAALIGPGGEIITSPFHLAVVEQLRREAGLERPPADAVPCDVFVFAIGEPPAPYLTKIGGHPYRPRARPWPKTADGRDRLFVAQLCFIDSRDIVPDVSGDVLLVFADPEDHYRSHEFEWLRIGEGDVLADADVPPAWYSTHTENPFLNPNAKPILVRVPPIVVVHGVIHRSWDLRPDDSRVSACPGGDRVARFEATKIGGVPVEIQSPVSGARSPIASIGSIQPIGDEPFPWVNREAPIPQAEVYALKTWQLGDMGTLNIVRDSSGRLSSDAATY
ncbi:MAG: hypothetical protein ACHREM_23160 [Polyangiales bacterium]